MSTLPAYSGQDLYGLIQSMIKEELSQLKITELAEVSEIFSHESDSDDNNYQVSAIIRDTGLLLPKVSIATQRVGSVAIPNVGDLVLVQFIGGDIHRPVITARVYNDVDRPPVANAGEWVFESQDSEASGVRRFSALFPNKNTITVDDDEANITIGDASIVISNDGNVTITAKADINFEAEGNISITAAGDLNIDSGAALNITSGADLTAEAGANATVTAAAAIAVEGAAEAKVKGAMVSIAGMTSFSAG